MVYMKYIHIKYTIVEQVKDEVHWCGLNVKVSWILMRYIPVLFQYSQEDLENKWIALASDVTNILSNEIQLPEQDHPIPFDGAADKPIDEQK